MWDAGREKVMKKPVQYTKTYYDYHECRDYICDKYKCDIDNFANKKYTGKPNDPPFQCFWHFVIDKTNCSNGTTFPMSNEWLKESKPNDWQKTVIEYFLSEFGKGKNREIEFYVSW